MQSIEKWWDPIEFEFAIVHQYDSTTKSWTTEECIIKIESSSFAKGVERQAYKAKIIYKREELDILNLNWELANNYVAKCNNANDLSDWSEDHNTAFDYVLTQYESRMWANSFNTLYKENLIDIIPTFVLELSDRPHEPTLTCEKYFGPNDVKFISYTSNSMHENIIPQLFFLYTFYASGGTSMVCHLDGLNGTYTNPQVGILMKFVKA